MSRWKHEQLQKQERFWDGVRKGWTWMADLHLAGHGVRAIAKVVDRAASTVSRELTRGGVPTRGPGRARASTARAAYAPYAAHQRAAVRARRPKLLKLEDPVVGAELSAYVSEKMDLRWSPAQISSFLRETCPERQELRVSPETIYQSLYVQGRGHLRADLHRQLRTGRAVRRPRATAGQSKWSKIPGAISISERPAEADDRAVPGHWEGDLSLGSNENTNGLLRQYFPKGTHLSEHSAEHLAVAAELNGRPRMILGWNTPAEAMNGLLSPLQSPTVATTP